MKRIILDTNIYGLIISDTNKEIVRDGIEKKKKVIAYNIPLIRKELRDTPRKLRVEGENLRNYLLRIYDEFTKGHEIKFISQAEELAEIYFVTYKELGGFAGKQEMLKDFIIRTYRIVNQIKQIIMPRFMNYEEFKKEIK